MKIDGTTARIASGLRINSAKDDAAGLAISQKLTSQESGLDQGVRNARQSADALNTAEGALGGISDSLNRMRELAVQASNGILTSDERKIIQTEIDQIKEGITDQARNTQFNTKQLLDGSFRDIATGTQPDGSGATVGVAGSTLAELGIENFDVTGSFDISTLDQAISRVSENRGQIGAQTNALESTIRSNEIARVNTTAANSRLRDADVAKEFSRLSQQNINQQYKLSIQKLQQQHEGNSLNLLL
ncbi:MULTISPECIES: flagellin [unclassified Fusibacter]|uniref:flagellin n=1 Tax=unclassified Fusibacter TaxID=2624464 RepID=UPI00101172DF|nr:MULTISPECIES: flagellin [unclassified Fusibacter]MCK8059817.1 flagellin [Fusibacter sp. A2]NPE21618.1 flagellin [Fusibacter sp. A1]RXV62024.1 flagellin [Fusibacter sp. A1]